MSDKKMELVPKDIEELKKIILQQQEQIQQLQLENAKAIIKNNKYKKGIDKSIVRLDSKQCTGCSACYNACPINAIIMVEDERGFIVPKVDENKCRNCGYCSNICPALNPRFINSDKQYCLAIMAEDEIRKNSASGGVFPVLAEYIISIGGYVCGAIWNESFGVEHCIINRVEDIYKLQGSKYVQSSINKIYKDIEKLLQEDKFVLFTGTPCQVDALLHYLGRDYEKLYTMEILCEGVPSQKIFQDYLNTTFKGRKIANIKLRDKEDNGWGINNTVEFVDGTKQKMIMQNSMWFQGFLRFYLNRDSCYQCQYNKKRRVADLTAGDFWGISNFYAQYDDKKGTSVLTINSKKGETLYYKVNDRFKLKEWLPLEYSIKANGAWVVHMWKPPKRELFFEMIKDRNYCDALEETLYDKKVYDVGIVGWWYYYNYGSILTYFALNRALMKMGYSSLMIHHTNNSNKASKLEKAFPENFIKKYCSISHFYNENDMYLLNKRCRAFISGSDQLWNPLCEKAAGKEFFLDFVDDNHLKISYASSLGNSVTANQEFINKYAPLAQRFDAISVREEIGIEGCKKIYGVDAVKVCDPVFLCEKEEFENLAHNSKLQLENKKYLLSFILDPDENKRRIIVEKSKELGVEYINLVDLTDAGEKAKKLGLENTKPFASVEDFMNYFMNASYIITDSFHGTCFSVIYNKEFISIANYGRGEKRVGELLNWLDIKGRIMYDLNMPVKTFKPEKLDYDRVNSKIVESRKFAKDWLGSYLKKLKIQ